MKTTFANPDDILNFTLTIEPDEGMYKGGSFVFTFVMNNNYPHDVSLSDCKKTGADCCSLPRSSARKKSTTRISISKATSVSTSYEKTGSQCSILTPSSLACNSSSSNLMHPTPSTKKPLKIFAQIEKGSGGTPVRQWEADL